MRNDAYWANRMKILEESLLDTGYEYAQNLERQYTAAIQEVEKQMASWYQRFAVNNEITLAEAQKMLTSSELEEFKWSVADYIAKGQEHAISGSWMKQLENASARVHVSRLDSLKLQLQQQAESLSGTTSETLNSSLTDIYSRGYYRTAFELQKGAGVGWSLHGLTDTQIKKVLSQPWTLDKQTFSDRIWSNKQQLINSVNTNLTQMIMRGQAPDKAIKAISERFNVSKSQAGRLVMTESAAFANSARQDCFQELGVEKYVIVETLDSETCPLCSALDGKVYPMSEYKVGLTAPPFHPWCRGTTAPYYEDMVGLGDRAARDGDGKTYDVPKDMTYKEWYDKTFTKPAEMRYNIFKDSVHAQIGKDYPLPVNSGQQGKHIVGSANFDPKRSTLTADPEKLIELYAGKGEPIQTKAGKWNQRERFVHSSEIGIYRDLAGNEQPTTVGIIHYTKKKGAHVVPAKPLKGATQS